MSQAKKVLIAYDGTKGAKGALNHLKKQRAGLPDHLEVLVLCIADVWSPTVSLGGDMPMTEYDFQAFQMAERQALKEARKVAVGAAQKLELDCPGWEVRAESCTESPAWGIIRRAEEWGAGLIVLGSHGRSVLGRFVLGSVSQAVVREAPCAVRVVRGRIGQRNAPVRLIIGFDGSPDAEAAIQAVAQRLWPVGSTVRLVTAIDGRLSTAVSIRRRDEPRKRHEATWMHRMIEDPVERLRAAGLTVSPVVKWGDPKRILVEEAKRWNAEGMFVGARGLRGIKRFLLGSVSTAVAMEAPCPVEVVRPTRASTKRELAQRPAQVQKVAA